MALIIRNALLVLADGLLSGGLRIDGAAITDVGPALVEDQAAHIIDAGGLLLAPGFVDLQLNGAFGYDFTADPDTMWAVAERLPRYGVTDFLPTIITAPPGAIPAAQAALARGAPSSLGPHARPLGLHLEGPFLNPAKRGAHPAEHLRLPAAEVAADWSRDSGVRLVTLAPELPGALDLTRQLVQRGVVVSMGHSAATYAEAEAGLDAGITYGTHLFNAMAPFQHREPGIAGTLLSDERAVAGLIVDGVHVHPGAIGVAWRAKGPGGLNLVTDAMAGLGLSEGTFRLGERDVTVQDGTVRLLDGTLAGSVLSLDHAVRNLIAMTGCGVPEAIQTVTEVPARLLGMTGRLGRLEPGAPADLVWLTPELNVAATWVGGCLTYQAEGMVFDGSA